MSPFLPDTVVHGTPAGYRAGCKSDQMCDDSAPWTCRRAYERSRGDYAFRRRVDQGMSPQEIHELEQQEEAAYAEAAVPPAPPAEKPAKTKAKRKPAALATDLARPAGYSPATVDAARTRIASAPEPTTPTAALVVTTTKEHPMPDTKPALPEGMAWKEPPATAFLPTSGPGAQNARIAHIARQQPREWICLGQSTVAVMTRWRNGNVAGTEAGEFEAVIDTGLGKGTKGDLYVRYVGQATS